MLIRFTDWAFRDRRTGRIVIGQWPNLWLWLFLAACVARALIGAEGLPGRAAGMVAAVALVVWAGDEVLRGVNPWRRGLGAAVLVGSLARLVV